MNAKTYILRVVFFTVLIVFAVLGLNYFADPYAITDTGRHPGFNQYKVDISNHTRLSKKYQPLLREYNALIIGNSRVEMGIDPSHHCFTQNELRVYNLGLPGASIRIQLNYALNVMYQQPIDAVLLSLDFTDFLSSSAQPEKRAPQLLKQLAGTLEYLSSGHPNPEFVRIKLLDYYKSLFSLDALVSSLKTVVLQGNETADRDENGFNAARDFAHAVGIEGTGALFEQKMHELEKKYSSPWYLRDTNGQLAQSFDDISAFLAMATKRGVEVYLFTNPFHESYWELMEEQSLMSVYADWMQSMTELVRAHQGRSVSMWNFSQNSVYIHEKIPGRGVKTGPLNWFWEPAHYRRELGDIMVDAMFSESCSREAVFGNKVI